MASSGQQNCPHCGKLVEPKYQDSPAGAFLICPECYKLIGRAED